MLYYFFRSELLRPVLSQASVPDGQSWCCRPVPPLACYLFCASLGTFRGGVSRHDTYSHVDSLPATYVYVVHDYAATSVTALYVYFMNQIFLSISEEVEPNFVKDLP
jgi:hypothetical protein